MNLHNIAIGNLNISTPVADGTIYINVGQTKTKGSVINRYEEYPVKINIALAQAIDLKFVDNINYTIPHYQIYISWNLSTQDIFTIKSNDFVGANDKIFKIVSVVENFNTGWVQVIGSEVDAIK